MVLPFMTIYLTGIGFSLFKAGIVVGMFGAGAIAGGYIGGKLTDKIGFYRIQLITLVGTNKKLSADLPFYFYTQSCK